MRLRLAALIFVLAFGVSASIVSAQGTAPSLDQGLRPFDTLNATDIDAVSMTNGNLILHAPLISYPQRGGKLKMSFSVASNGKNWMKMPCTGTREQCAPWRGQWTWIGTNVNSGGSGLGIVKDQTITLSGAAINGVMGKFTIPFAVTADGAAHELGATAAPVFGFSGTQPPEPGESYTSMETLDGSGIQFQGNGVSLDYAGPIIDRDGIRYTPVGGLYGLMGIPLVSTEDPNGNQIVASSTGWTDTVGRSIPTPGGPPTNTTNCPTGTTGAESWNLPGPYGGTSPIKICSGDFTFSTQYHESGWQEGTASVGAITGLVLPNSTSWQFTYDSQGDVTSVTLPTGATISYTWTPTIGYSNSVASRSINLNNGSPIQTWNYQWCVSVNGSIANIVTDPLGNDTVYFTGFPNGTPECLIGYTLQTQYFQGSHATGTLLKTVSNTYSYLANPDMAAAYGLGGYYINVVPITETTSWPNGQVSQVQKTYDSGHVYYWVDFNETDNPTTTYPITYGSLVQKVEYDYGKNNSGPLLRTTNTTYEWQQSSTYLANNLLNLPYSVKVTNGSGTQVALTTFGYDEASLTPSGITEGHAASSPDGNARGNQTSLHEWQNGSAVATTNCGMAVSNGYLVSYQTFFDTGTVYQSTDPCGSSAGDSKHTTTYAYSPTYQGAYPTTIENPLSQITTRTYDFDTGLPTSTTDPNGQPTIYSYDDMWRLESETYPDRGETSYSFNDTTPSPSITMSKKITTSGALFTQVTVLDGLGRVTETELTSDPQGTDYATTAYDADGHVSEVSNPYRSGNTVLYTQYGYDALNRKLRVTETDGSTIATVYCGSSTLVTDEAGKWRRSTTDGLGRLIEVDEPNSPTAMVNSNGCPGTSDPIWVTSYSYDALDDLVGVVQGGSRQRSFVYDSLKRLTSSTNPEAGNVAYTYDADDNVATKTDARGITITYSWDSLNRLTGRTYSNGDPAVGDTYDQVVAGYSNIGRRTSVTDAGGSETVNYDSMGRELTEQRVTNSVTKNTFYTYNLDGSLATLTYPGGRVITYSYNAAAQPISAVDVANSINYATNAAYAPNGALAQVQNGSNLVTTHIYNQRLQPCWVFATTGSPLPWQSTTCTSTATPAGNILDLKYNFNLATGDNGDVFGITNNRDTTRSQTFTYDQVNRIVTGGTPSPCGANCWSQSFTYDQWANFTAAAATGTAPPLTLSVNANNQVSTTGFTFDGVGNETHDATFAYVWNAESEIKTGGGVNYTYDGDGDRVEKSNGKIYWYGAGSEILDESDATGNFTDEYVFFGGQRIAHRAVSSGSIYYYAEDMLGSSRSLVLAGQTSPCYDADFYPYGGEHDYTNTCPQNYKFTGKERDAETDNDDFDARYYSSTYGRFLSADWSAVPAPVPYANLANPQTLNLYAMVHDNPETFADLDGHQEGEVDPAEEARDEAEFEKELSEVLSGNGANTVSTGASPFSVAHDDPITGICYTGLGNEPPQLRAGKEAHNSEEIRPGEKAEVTTPSGKGRMDRYDRDKAHIREIKPDNARGEKTGKKQLSRYKQEMDKATGRTHTTELTKYNKQPKTTPPPPPPPPPNRDPGVD